MHRTNRNVCGQDDLSEEWDYVCEAQVPGTLPVARYSHRLLLALYSAKSQSDRSYSSDSDYDHESQNRLLLRLRLRPRLRGPEREMAGNDEP
jgi:hypothetical protein